MKHLLEKKHRPATQEEAEAILKFIVNQYDEESRKFFKEKIDDDEKIETYVSWKNTLSYIIANELKTTRGDLIIFNAVFISEKTDTIFLNFILENNVLNDYDGDYLIAYNNQD